MDLSIIPEWRTPSGAVAADFGSQKRLQAAIICAMLDLSARKSCAETRAQERKLQVEFDDLKSVGVLLASLLKAEGL